MHCIRIRIVITNSQLALQERFHGTSKVLGLSLRLR
ncbi:unnamed protein product [Chondrus crispus]|uniref:Uncharacterized protein n=1 Tax=Chondrus crispus TaxID=2769 RepID=R7QKE1_CHOCR|nr:unnamed protein product [Chondrus crispus]CDF37875.1 unnamed protein product [Chondrus crispus]|eukprot:XP_005717746.1 unnamed protein product [Chondrus crispus]